MMTAQQMEFMREAIHAAEEGLAQGKGGPFGAVVVRNGQIIGRGCNNVLSTNDPTAHAEVMAIRDACKNIGSFQLDNCELYTTCEPCPMCLGAIYWARPLRVYYASTRHDAATAGFDDSFIYNELNLDFDARSIPMINMMPDEAEGLFEIWKTSPLRKPY